MWPLVLTLPDHDFAGGNNITEYGTRGQVSYIKKIENKQKFKKHTENIDHTRY